MGSILKGYEYDVFISYRQNDNRSGWVTKFVAALQEELAAKEFSAENYAQKVIAQQQQITALRQNLQVKLRQTRLKK